MYFYFCGFFCYKEGLYSFYNCKFSCFFFIDFVRIWCSIFSFLVQQHLGLFWGGSFKFSCFNFVRFGVNFCRSGFFLIFCGLAHRANRGFHLRWSQRAPRLSHRSSWV